VAFLHACRRSEPRWTPTNSPGLFTESECVIKPARDQVVDDGKEVLGPWVIFWRWGRSVDRGMSLEPFQPALFVVQGDCTLGRIMAEHIIGVATFLATLGFMAAIVGGVFH
jgi:hypothetical protein